MKFPKPIIVNNPETASYERVGIYQLEEVLPFVDTEARSKRESKTKDYDGHIVKMGSARYQLFATKGITCVKCGLVGSFFALEMPSTKRDPNNIYHFNLYALDNDGKEVMMTKDHILPKSKGGINHLENYQVMCVRCNCEKGNGDKRLRKLASIQVIKEINPIPGADKIQVAKILGWEVVVLKDEFKPGDLCVYFEIDSLLPVTSWSDFLKNKDKPEKPIRLKTIRLRGQISQGLAIPLDAAELTDVQEGDDVTEKLGVIKYEPPIPACLSGEARGSRPSYVPKTDEERIQAFPGLIDEFQGKEVYISQKIDGTSGSFSNLDGDIHVCGRNWSYKESEKNTYWKVFRKYDLENKLKEAGNYAIQGEVAGPSIQKNRLKLKDHELFVFNVLQIDGRKFLDYEEFIAFCNDYELQTVPIISVVEFNYTLEQLLIMARGTYSSGKNQEGIVIRPVVGFRSGILGGRASFKVINNEFLLGGGN